MKNSKTVYMTALLLGLGLPLGGCAGSDISSGLKNIKSKLSSSVSKRASKQQAALPEKGRIRVGLYALKGLGVARKIRDELRAGGHDAYIRPAGKLRALYVGRNLNPQQAKQLKRRLDAQLKTNTLVVAM